MRGMLTTDIAYHCPILHIAQCQQKYQGEIKELMRLIN